jgi:NTP pyrophosphatase (non-canonical NTP hydrolase)
MAQFQQTVATFVKENELEAPVHARVLDLVSEVGELAKEILKVTDYGRQPFRPTEEWSGELADILYSLTCVANSTGVDLETALNEALDKYEGRLARKGDAGSGPPEP